VSAAHADSEAGAKAGLRAGLEAGSGLVAVIVSYRTGPALFDALAAALDAGDIDRVVLVDNGNPSDAEARLDARAASEPRLTVVRGQGNVGFARACNLGAQAAAAEHLLFLNPDAVIEPGASRALVAAGAGRTRPWIAGARLLDLKGHEQRGGRRRAPTLGRALGALLGADRMHLEREPSPSAPILVDAVSGAAMVMRADDFAALGGFDERYFLHAEDLDICARALRAGGAVVFVPAAVARHQGGSSEASSAFVEWCKGRGLARYLVRFAPGPLARAAAVVLGPLIVLAAVARGAMRDRKNEGTHATL
jgi:N-acetylglucosaminyl-diphospho-decaprenol L-rhamnosyltransferase